MMIKNVLARIFNSLVEGLNRNKGNDPLPRLLVVIPDADILKFINHYTYGVSAITGRCLNWLITNMDRVIEAKKEQLQKKKAGAVAANEPKIIWVKMLDTPNMTYSDLMACRKKYNAILDDILAQKRNHYVIDINDEMYHISHFLWSNTLNARGETRFWREIDQLLEAFDYNREKLLPGQMAITPRKPIQQVKPVHQVD